MREGEAAAEGTRCSWRGCDPHMGVRYGCGRRVGENGSATDIGGEVRHPPAYADDDPSKAISGAGKGRFGSTHSPLLSNSLTSPPISATVTPYTPVPHPASRTWVRVRAAMRSAVIDVLWWNAVVRSQLWRSMSMWTEHVAV